MLAHPSLTLRKWIKKVWFSTIVWFLTIVWVYHVSGFTLSPSSCTTYHEQKYPSTLSPGSLLVRNRPMKPISTTNRLSFSSDPNNNEIPEISSCAMTSGYKIICSSTDTLYDVLGVSSTADFIEIKSAYRLLARQTHPDVISKGGAADWGKRDFTEIAAAWEILSDPIQRAQYDRSLTFSRDVRELITSLLDERLGNEIKVERRDGPAPSQTFTGSMEKLISDLIEDVGQEGQNSKENTYLTQKDYTTMSAITDTVVDLGGSTQQSTSLTYYDILGVSPQATRTEIKQAYFALAKQTHPDTRPKDLERDDNNDMDFYDISEAWKILSDPEEKMRYDRDLLADSFTQGVETFAAKVVREVGPSVQQLMEKAVIPFVRELTGATLNIASRLAATAVIYWDKEEKK